MIQINLSQVRGAKLAWELGGPAFIEVLSWTRHFERDTIFHLLTALSCKWDYLPVKDEMRKLRLQPESGKTEKNLWTLPMLLFFLFISLHGLIRSMLTSRHPLYLKRQRKKKILLQILVSGGREGGAKQNRIHGLVVFLCTKSLQIPFFLSTLTLGPSWENKNLKLVVQRKLPPMVWLHC